MELALGGGEKGQVEGSCWMALLDTNSRAAREYSSGREVLQRKGEQAATFLNLELTGALATGPAIVEQSRPGESCRQELNKEREELQEAVLRETSKQIGGELCKVLKSLEGHLVEGISYQTSIIINWTPFEL